MRADLGYPILGGVQGWSQKQVVSGMSMTTGSWDSVANWGPAAQLVPNQATPSRSTRLTKNSVCGVRAWALGYGENREDEISPVLPSHTSRKPWPSGSGSASRLPRSQDSGQRGNLEEIRDGGGRTPKNHSDIRSRRDRQNKRRCSPGVHERPLHSRGPREVLGIDPM